MDRDEISNLYRGPSIDASYLDVSVHLAEEFQRRRLKCEKLTDDGRQVMAKAHLAKAKMGARDSQPQVIKFTSCLPMVGGSLQVLRLLPPLKLAAII
jgi:hypothetical protein